MGIETRKFNMFEYVKQTIWEKNKRYTRTGDIWDWRNLTPGQGNNWDRNPTKTACPHSWLHLHEKCVQLMSQTFLEWKSLIMHIHPCILILQELEKKEYKKTKSVWQIRQQSFLHERVYHDVGLLFCLWLCCCCVISAHERPLYYIKL